MSQSSRVASTAGGSDTSSTSGSRTGTTVTDAAAFSATAPPPAPRMTPLLALRDTGGVAKRNLLRVLRTPQLLLISIVQPMMLLLLFRYILGGAIRVPGGDYVDYVVPAIFLETVLIGSMTTAIGLAEDLKSGLIDRMRSLPMARSAVLAGRTVADLLRTIVSLGSMIGLGVASGFRFHAPIPQILLAIAVILAFGYAVSWIYASVGLASKDPETAQVAGVMPMFILLFASSAFVPIASMPGWLQPIARDQPFTLTLDAVRALTQGGPATHYVWTSAAWSGGIFVFFFALSLQLYRRAV